MSESLGEQPSASALAQELRALVGKLKRRLLAQSHVGDLTQTQISVLIHLEKHGAATASDLARVEGMRPQSMGAVIAVLEAAGHVSGAADPSDGRRTLLSLTQTCRRWIEDSRSARQDWLSRRIEARLSLAERTELGLALALLASSPLAADDLAKPERPAPSPCADPETNPLM